LSQEFIVRPLEGRDFEAVSKIQGAMVEEYQDYLRRIKKQDRIRLCVNEAYFDYYVKTGSSFVAEIGHKVVGFVLSQTVNFMHGDERLLWLEDIAVLPQFRRREVCSALVPKILKYAKKQQIRRVNATLNPNNEKWRGLLLRAGFSVKEWLIAYHEQL